jgi:hypothetical protein
MGSIAKETSVNDDMDATAEWYLTVRCTHPSCARLIAFKKAIYCSDHSNLRLAVTGKPSVNCPYCRTLVQFHPDQIERRQVVLMQ